MSGIKRKAPAATEANHSNNIHAQINTSNTGCNDKKITFPNGRNRTHGLAILAMLVRGDDCNQYSYHELTGYPTTDCRTRISELGLIHGWQIERAWTHATDHNGQVQRCKHYWIDRDWLSQMYAANPELERRCELLAYCGEVQK